MQESLNPEGFENQFIDRNLPPVTDKTHTFLPCENEVRRNDKRTIPDDIIKSEVNNISAIKTFNAITIN